MILMADQAKLKQANIITEDCIDVSATSEIKWTVIAQMNICHISSTGTP